MSRVEIIGRSGFDPKAEVEFLKTVIRGNPDLVLRSEVVTQVSEDVGLIKHNKSYEITGGHVVDPESNLRLVDVCQGEEEMRWMRMIEVGLLRDKNVLQVRPKRLTEEVDCFDFWSENEGKVKWMRMEVVRGSKVLMGPLETRLTEVTLEPTETEMRLAEVLLMFDLAKERSEMTFEMIKTVTDGLFLKFKDWFGERLLTDPELIKRFYSAVHAELGRMRQDVVLVRAEVDDLDRRMISYARAPMEMVKIQSFGCDGSTMVGVFGRLGEGYYVTGAGKVVRGEIPLGYTLCKKCGVYYRVGGACPFCP